MKILHVINGLGLAGAEQVLLNLLKNRAPDIRASVARLLDESDLDAAVRETGSEVTALHLCARRDLPQAIIRLRRLIARVNPDIIHSHLLHAEILTAAVSRLTRRSTVVATVHNVMWSERGYYPRWLRWTYRRALLLNDHNIAVAGAVGDAVRECGVPSDRVTVIRNGIEPEPLLPRATARSRLGISGNDFVIGAIGNLHPYKGHDLLLRVVASLRHQRRDVKVVIIGGPVRAEAHHKDGLMREAKEIGLADHLYLAGRVPNAASLLNAFDIYVQPSRTEGASMALMEAMAAGLPCIATAAGGTPDLIGSSGGAVIVPVDDAEAFRCALERLITDEDHRSCLAVRARSQARLFRADRMADEYDTVYRRLLAARGVITA